MNVLSAKNPSLMFKMGQDSLFYAAVDNTGLPVESEYKQTSDEQYNNGMGEQILRSIIRGRDGQRGISKTMYFVL